VPIETAINSFLQDGAIVATPGHDNREGERARSRLRQRGIDERDVHALRTRLIGGQLDHVDPITHWLDIRARS
jgi:hypothetical protein